MVHRLLCCSDTHSQLPPALDEDGATAWLHAGDVVEGPQVIEDAGDPMLDLLRAPVAGWFVNRPIPVLVVKGNHDVTDDLLAFRHAQNITGKIVTLAAGLHVAGVGWCGKRFYDLPLEQDLRLVCDAVRQQASQLLTPNDNLVLLTHYPPRFPGYRELKKDMPNGGIWYDCVRELAEDLRPLAVVQGHMHQWMGTSQTVPIGDAETLVFHPGRMGGSLILDLQKRSVAVSWPA